MNVALELNPNGNIEFGGEVIGATYNHGFNLVIVEVNQDVVKYYPPGVVTQSNRVYFIKPKTDNVGDLVLDMLESMIGDGLFNTYKLNVHQVADSISRN